MSARLHRCLVLLGVGVLLIQVGYWFPIQLTRDEPIDSEIYHHAAQEIAVGRAVYGTWAPAQLDYPSREFLYPPTALLFLKPFGATSRHSFNVGFYVLVLAAFWAIAAALVKIVRDKLTVLDVLAAGAVLQLVPGMLPMMKIGNADIFVWALIAWAFAAPRMAGVLLALAAALKIYPAALIAVWVWRAPRRFGRQAAVASASILLATWLVLGSGIFHEWATVGMRGLHEGIFWRGNVSLSTAVVHVFVRDTVSPLPHAASVFLAVFPWVAVVAVAVWQRHRSVAKHGLFVLIAAVWVAPICWWWRLPVALTVAVAVWVRERKELLCEPL